MLPPPSYDSHEADTGEERAVKPGVRSARRLLGALMGLALIGPLSTVIRPNVAAAAPNDFVTMSDGVSIAVPTAARWWRTSASRRARPWSHRVTAASSPTCSTAST
jgi:hypothetical protein